MLPTIQERFQDGIEPERYFSEIRNYRRLVKDLYAEASAPEPWTELLSSVVDDGTLVTVTTEDWCGDSACVVPLITRMCAAVDLPFRIFRGSEHGDLKEFYESQGATHIPVLSVWSADGEELFRWIEKPAACEKPAEDWKAAHPDFYTLYAATDPESKRRFARLYREFLEEMADWYRNGLWDETAREIAEGLRNTQTQRRT